MNTTTLIPPNKFRHLSGSSINTFIERKNQFYVTKILSRPFIQGPSMSRGKAVENTVNAWAAGKEFKDLEETYLYSNQQYEQEMANYRVLFPNLQEEDAEKEKKIKESVPGLAALAVETYMDIFDVVKPSMQTPIRMQYDGVPMEVIGFTDYYRYGQMVRDCKVLGQSKKSLPQAYCITGAIYKTALKVPVFYDLFIANKVPKYICLELTDDDYKFGMSYGAAAAKALVELNECQDPKRFFELCCFPNLDEIYDPAERQEAADRWNIWLPTDR